MVEKAMNALSQERTYTTALLIEHGVEQQNRDIIKRTKSAKY